MEKMVSILGCGWYGQGLANALLRKGWLVKGSVTKYEKLALLQQQGIQPFLIDLQNLDSTIGLDDFFTCDTLIIACNVNLGNRANYLLEIQALIKKIKTSAIRKIIFISSVSVYGEPCMVVNEQSPPHPDTESAQLLLAAEELLLAETQLDVTILRFGGLIGPGRMPGKFLSGKKDIPNGLAPVNLIHLQDCIGLTQALINSKKMIRHLNGVSPDHPTRKDFYCLAAETEKLPLPDFVLDKHKWKEVNSLHGHNFYEYQVFNLTKWLFITNYR
ncbi:NAD(P)H-binding protein [Mucilaginibacter sp. KACC 22063]|uniref:NAD(P)H-binding protein n=1 Tax=Mucilaginibacter sp. KACC 22063 TaxID=3025666 RepID=UPI002366DDEC|nr:NAD(P)H-binding protein [Mucilaginibacter sp. KACC 22063]WDF57369.1 NAD(P)H-binding protein [Mucilaginibacter sp. KACC 22063]